VWREFRRTQSKGTKTWAISVEADGEGFRIRQGELGGTPVESPVKIPGARGRLGSRTYVSATDACSREVERLTKMQLQKGYCEFIDGHALISNSTPIDFARPFPPDLTTPKPRASISANELEKLHNAGKLSYTRKYDGIGLTLVHHTYGWEAYTLSNNCVSDHFLKQLEALKNSELPVGTIFKAEAVIFKKDEPWREDFNLINSRFGPTRNPETTQAMIERGEIPEPSFVIYDILYHNGTELHDVPYQDRTTYWRDFPVARGGNGPILSAEFITDLTPNNWEARRIELKIEGWVANDKQAVLGKNALSYSQAPARPSGIYKLKPNTEEDVVVFAVREVDGEYQSVFTKQRYPDFYPDTNIPVPNAGEWFYCGRVSLHRSPVVAKEIDKLVKSGQIHSVPDNKTGEALSLDNNEGVTIVVEFFERQKGGKFRHGKFPEELRIRTRDSGDFKAPEQCIAQNLSIPD
jgi:ATP-dependent DNA ligase